MNILNWLRKSPKPKKRVFQGRGRRPRIIPKPQQERGQLPRPIVLTE